MDPRESHGETRRRLSSQTCSDPIPIKHTNVIPTNIDHIPSNAMNSDSSAMLYVFDDNEAVFKMIIKGRSPTMRNVSRTHRELLWIGCLTGLIWTPKFKSVTLTPNTKSQTCWLKETSHVMSGTIFCSICCTKNFSLISCSTMAKRIQNQEEEERAVSKSRPSAMIFSSFIATSSSTASSPIAKSGDADCFGETQ